MVLIATLISSCKYSEKHEDVKTTSEIIQDETDLLSTAWMDDIQLENGKKWDANLETTEGVQKMQDLLKVEVTTSIEDYHQLASQLNDVKNNVLKECTMKGASHDNLHIWLYPLIEKIAALSETNTIEEASKIKQSISENLDVYSDYFK